MAAVEAPRLAKNYATIYDIVRERGAGMHWTAAEVFAHAKTVVPGIGETTVYRALARLRELGLLSEISIPGSDRAYYEVPAAAHAHFICERCGAVSDVDYMLPARIVGDLAVRHAADIAHVQLSLHGVCAACRTKPD